MMLWFRLHNKLLHDPRVQLLDAEIYKIYINCLCYAAERDDGGNLGEISDVSFVLRETENTVSSAFHVLEKDGLIVTVGETFHIPQWKKKQYKSDTSTGRVRKFRDKRKRSRNVTVTAPEQNRTDKKDTNKLVSKKPTKTGVIHGKRIEAEFGKDWRLPEKYHAYARDKGLREIESEVQRFFRHWTSPDAKNRTKKDWWRTWQNWVDNALKWSGSHSINSNGAGHEPSSIIDLTAEIISERSREPP